MRWARFAERVVLRRGIIAVRSPMPGSAAGGGPADWPVGLIRAGNSHALPGAGKTDACRKPDGSSADNDDIE